MLSVEFGISFSLSKAMNTCARLIAFLWVAAFSLGCDRAPTTNNLIGKWRELSFDNSFIEYFKDGTFTTDEESGTFSILEDGRLKRDSVIFGTPQIETYSDLTVDRGVLTMTDTSGRGRVFVKETPKVKAWQVEDSEYYRNLLGQWSVASRIELDDGTFDEQDPDVVTIERTQWFGIQAIKVSSTAQGSAYREIIVPTEDAGRFMCLVSFGDERRTKMYVETLITGKKGTDEVLFQIHSNSLKREWEFHGKDRITGRTESKLNGGSTVTTHESVRMTSG